MGGYGDPYKGTQVERQPRVPVCVTMVTTK